MATVSADDTRQDADNTVSELCSHFPTAVQVSTSDGENPQLHRKTANSRRQRGRAGKNKTLVSTPRPRDANSTSTCTTAWHSVVLVFSNFLFKAFQGCLSPGQAPAIPSTDASSPSASACATQYYSAFIQSMIEHRAKCSDDVEYEIASSKVHWSTVERPAGRTSERRSAAQEGGGSSESEGEEVIDERELDKDILKANRKAILEQRQHRAWGRCFQKNRDRLYERREKIAEGGEAKIYAGIRTDILEGKWGRHVVFKVFPRGLYLRDLVKLWPEAAFSSPCERGTKIEHVMLLPNDGRIALVMSRAWGDLRTLIDRKMVANGNEGPPFNTKDVFDKMNGIAHEMRWLHEDDVVHRDLKASNVLLYGDGVHFSTSNLERIGTAWLETISDYECALGVMGTGFWRAPEVLLGMRDPKKRCSPTLFTKKSDVYSYGMLCYEIATGFFPFEREGFSGTRGEQDLVINGKRPSFPDDVDGRVKDLITRCWHQDEDKRPTFTEIRKETNIWHGI
ncbi:hypothetical protein M758_11G097500 [Ceratodon purpureus]|nr:hypothetical protein M758_11G097500 [Ceratodon purpureus]